jgi:hypothetical protein
MRLDREAGAQVVVDVGFLCIGLDRSKEGRVPFAIVSLFFGEGVKGMCRGRKEETKEEAVFQQMQKKLLYS